MGFRAFLIKRLTIALVMLIIVLLLNFIIFMVMPGDPVSLFVNPVRGSPEGKKILIERLKAQWGLDKPIEQRILIYVQNMLTWNFGNSIMSNNPVSSEIGIRLWYTLELMGTSTFLAILLGILFGAFVASRRGGKLDSIIVTSSLITFSLPVFWIGLMFILIFSIGLRWFPHAQAYPFSWDLPGRWPVAFTLTSSVSPQWNGNVVLTLNPSPAMVLFSGYLSHMVLPVATLTLFQYGGYLLLTRATMIEALTEDYVVTARAKGVKEREVILRHALKNASLPLITSAALHFGFMFGGAIITEGVYSWPGLGRWIFSAIGQNDYSVLQAAFYIIAVCVIAANIVADLLYGIIDPRIKYAGA